MLTKLRPLFQRRLSLPLTNLHRLTAVRFYTPNHQTSPQNAKHENETVHKILEELKQKRDSLFQHDYYEHEVHLDDLKQVLKNLDTNEWVLVHTVFPDEHRGHLETSHSIKIVDLIDVLEKTPQNKERFEFKCVPEYTEVSNSNSFMTCDSTTKILVIYTNSAQQTDLIKEVKMKAVSLTA